MKPNPLPFPGASWGIMMDNSLDASCLAWFLKQKLSELSGKATLLTREAPIPPGGVGELCILHASYTTPNRIARTVRHITHHGAQVVLVTEDTSPEITNAALHAGATATHDQNDPPQGLVSAVRRLIQGHEHANTTESFLWKSELSLSPSYLSPKEEQVVALLFEDEASLTSVAAQMQISVNTVRNHVSNIRKKLQPRSTKNRMSLRFALEERGWL